MPSRPGAAAILAACAAAVLLAGCGVAGPAVSGPTRQQLHQALRKWSGFPVSRRPRPLVLAAPHVNGPPHGFPSAAAKLAFISGAIDPLAALPAGPARAAGYPLISAGEAFRALIPAAAQGPAAGIRLEVSTARLGRAGFMTDRGMRRLPAWLFGFRGVRGSAAVLAVAPAGIFSPPRAGLRSLVSTARLGSNRRTLTAEFVGAAAGTGPCTAGYQLELAESRTAVVVGILEHDHAGGMSCAAGGYPRRATATLPVPLGARVVVDAVSGTAVAVTEAPPRG